jgi:choloylglycine hydrolase
MRFARRHKLAIVVLATILPSAAFPCTTFCIRTDDHVVFGKNLDWMVEDGLVMVNKRGISKAAYTSTNPVRWVSEYGSLTFNQYGRDAPMGGINEAGLVVENMWLEGSQYPAADARPELGALEWIQYQLDTAASVAEVLASDGALRIRSNVAPLHFLVCDRAGDCATVEFLGGRRVVHSGEQLPAAALTNSTYDRSLAFLRETENESAPRSARTSYDSVSRFARAARGARSFDPQHDASAIEHAFAVLDSVAVKRTQWRVVYDLTAGRVYFRTRSRPEVRHADLRAFDLPCASPVMMLDMSRALSGNVAAEFTEYTFDANHALVRSAYRQTPFLKDVAAETLEHYAHAPERTVCSAKSDTR